MGSRSSEQNRKPEEEPSSGSLLNGFVQASAGLSFAVLGMMYGLNGFGNMPDLKVLFVMISCLLVCAGCRFSLSVPRPCATTRWTDVGVHVLMFIGDMVLLPYYILRPSSKCELTYDDSSEANRRLIEQVPLLRDYPITPWLRNSWIALGRVSILELLSFTWDKAKYCSTTRREIIPMEDGGQVALDWYTGGEDLPASAPVLYMAPTLMGDGCSHSTKEVADYFTANGWRCVCFVKRGGGYFDPLPINTWVPTDPLSFAEVTMGLKKVRERYPDSFVGLAGLSAGGNWVRRYCAAAAAGLEPDLADAAMAMDGAWEWSSTVDLVDVNTPIIAKVLAGALARPLLVKAASETPPAWLNVTSIVSSLQTSWLSTMGTCHRAAGGFATTEEYFEATCDKTTKLKQSSNIPILILTSYADGCSPRDFWIKTDKVAEIPSQCSNTFVCINAQGAHCCRPSGWFGKQNWGAMSTLEFFDAVAARGKTSQQVPARSGNSHKCQARTLRARRPSEPL